LQSGARPKIRRARGTSLFCKKQGQTIEDQTVSQIKVSSATKIPQKSEDAVQISSKAQKTI